MVKLSKRERIDQRHGYKFERGGYIFELLGYILIEIRL